jgi:hypothetical protein
VLVTLFKHVDISYRHAISEPTGRRSMTYAGRAGQSLVGAAALILGLGLLAWSCSTGAAASPTGRVARTLNVADEAHLHITHSSGELLQEEGTATGALPGTVRVRFRIATSVSGSFTIYPRGGGSISGQASGRLHSTGTYASFGGSITISHGTGRYAHTHGHGGFYGTVNRRTDALVIQTTGRLSY